MTAARNRPQRSGAGRIQVFGDAEVLARASADWMCRTLRARSGALAVCLAGGSTPRLMYEIVALEHARRLPWQRIHWFFGDERFVPHDHPDSNFAMFRGAMAPAGPLALASVHAVPTSDPTPAAAAARYERALKDHYGAETLDPRRPLFDLTFLGLGEDGHTASLFPGSAALDEAERWVVSTTSPRGEPRITLTYPALASSRQTAFVVAGRRKRSILGRVWEGEDLPATRLRPAGALHWFIDAEADPRAR